MEGNVGLKRFVFPGCYTVCLQGEGHVLRHVIEVWKSATEATHSWLVPGGDLGVGGYVKEQNQDKGMVV